jgi:O-antigen ligase
MRVFSASSVRRLESSRGLAWMVGILTLMCAAILIGRMIGQENWMLLGIVVVMILALRWPIQFALALYAFLLPFNSITSLGDSQPGTTANYAIGALAGMAMLATGIVKKRLTLPPRAALWWLSFVVWAVLSIAWALQPQAAIKQLPTTIALLMLYIVGVAWRPADNELPVLTRVIIAGGCFAACYVSYQFANGISYAAQYGVTGRATMVAGGAETNPNSIGSALLLPFSLAVAWFVSARDWLNTGLGLAATGLIAYAVFLTMSRSSLLAIVIVLGIYLYRLGFNRRVLTIVSGLLLLVFTMPEEFFSRLLKMISSGGDGRLEIWDVGLVLLRRYGIVGAGLINFPIAYSEYAGYAPRFQGFGRGAHNLYLSTIVDFGIVGFLLMLAAVTSHLLALRRFKPASSQAATRVLALECACWGMLIAAFFGDPLWSKPFWLIWMLSLMAIRFEMPGVTTLARWPKQA